MTYKKTYEYIVIIIIIQYIIKHTNIYIYSCFIIFHILTIAYW